MLAANVAPVFTNYQWIPMLAHAKPKEQNVRWPKGCARCWSTFETQKKYPRKLSTRNCRRPSLFSRQCKLEVNIRINSCGLTNSRIGKFPSRPHYLLLLRHYTGRTLPVFVVYHARVCGFRSGGTLPELLKMFFIFLLFSKR